MSEPILQTVARYYRGWENTDRDAIVATLADSFVFRAPMDDFDSSEAFLDACLERFGGMAFEFDSRLATDDEAVVLYRMPDGLPVAEHLRLIDGKIAAIRVYFGGRTS